MKGSCLTWLSSAGNSLYDIMRKGVHLMLHWILVDKKFQDYVIRIWSSLNRFSDLDSTEKINLFGIVSNSEKVGNCNKVPPSKRSLWTEDFFAKVMNKFQQPFSKGIRGLMEKCVMNRFLELDCAKTFLFGLCSTEKNVVNHIYYNLQQEF